MTYSPVYLEIGTYDTIPTGVVRFRSIFARQWHPGRCAGDEEKVEGGRSVLNISKPCNDVTLFPNQRHVPVLILRVHRMKCLGHSRQNHSRSRYMMEKLSTRLFTITLFLVFFGLGFYILEESETEVSINGVVCNHSSTGVWLAMSEGERQKAYSLAPGQCTDFFKQDAEAIWGRDCSMDPCEYQAWKLGAGRFAVEDDPTSPSKFVLRINGWGAGSSWHITEDWPRPKLSSISYSLVR